MIKVTFYKNKNKMLGFLIENHGLDIVCSAVSILSLNTINSIEKFTNTECELDYDNDGGFLKYLVKKDTICDKSSLLLDSLELGLNGILLEYENEIDIKYKEV